MQKSLLVWILKWPCKVFCLSPSCIRGVQHILQLPGRRRTDQSKVRTLLSFSLKSMWPSKRGSPSKQLSLLSSHHNILITRERYVYTFCTIISQKNRHHLSLALQCNLILVEISSYRWVPLKPADILGARKSVCLISNLAYQDYFPLNYTRKSFGEKSGLSRNLA